MIDADWHYDHIDKDYGGRQPAKYFADYLYELETVEYFDLLSVAYHIPCLPEEVDEYEPEDVKCVIALEEIREFLQGKYDPDPETEFQQAVYKFLVNHYNKHIRDEDEWE